VAVVLLAEMLILEPQLVLQVVRVVAVLKTALLVVLVVAEILPQLLHRKEMVAELVMVMVLLGVAVEAVEAQALLVQTHLQVERQMALVLAV
jgi:hypothetical protein